MNITGLLTNAKNIAETILDFEQPAVAQAVAEGRQGHVQLAGHSYNWSIKGAPAADPNARPSNLSQVGFDVAVLIESAAFTGHAEQDFNVEAGSQIYTITVRVDRVEFAQIAA